ncbi:hypothetical protein [Xanthomonas euvesicatoria]|uniref:hypothetical protein n=1 Tax=Xanthomonas euvesicatoria TaxID=456327 RepID=UPI001C485C0B|nr:hypothetical protein [Xanthomonas euvesicatoria]MBV6829103.1 hypothetical protein [Xanthomonas campestris pv. viegasii]MCP3048526.1 hypothetical protein [Xanthomonas euvesicatoria pv. allii]
MKILIRSFFCALLVLACSAGCREWKSGKASLKSNDIRINVDGLSAVEVGVVTPDKKFIFMKSEEFLCRGILQKGGMIFIDPSAASGYMWDNEGIKREVVVFSKKGIYRVVASENLETEFDNSSARFFEYNNRDAHKFDLGGSCSIISKGG